MNWIDIGIIVVLAIAAFSGLRMGIIKVFFSLVGLIVGITLAGRYYASLAPRLTFISDEGVAKIAAFAIILVGVMIIAAVLAYLLRRVASMMMLGWVNRLGGAIFGLAVGVIFFSTLLAIWVNFLGMGRTVSGSVMAAFLLDFFPFILALLPDEFDYIRSFFQ